MDKTTTFWELSCNISSRKSTRNVYNKKEKRSEMQHVNESFRQEDMGSTLLVFRINKHCLLDVQTHTDTRMPALTHRHTHVAVGG